MLRGSMWSAGFEFYDYNQDYEFGSDGAATLWHGYAQAMRLQANIGFRLLGRDEMEFYPVQPESWWLPSPVRARFVLETGAFTLARESHGGGAFTLLFGARLRLDPDPLEDAINAWERGMPYYGWCVDADPLDDPARVLESRLKHWAEADGTGYAEGVDTSLFRLPDGREYDFTASWARKELWRAGTRGAELSVSPYIEIIPEMIACVADEPVQVRTWTPAIEAFLERGTRLAWIFDRSRKQVHEFRSGRPTQVLDDPPELVGDPVLPGLCLRTSWIL